MPEFVSSAMTLNARRFDKGGDNFYDQISALHKSVRGSADGALYWFCRMIDGGADPKYLARRIVRMAWEDIGLADPRALQVANDAAETYERLGSPEGSRSAGGDLSRVRGEEQRGLQRVQPGDGVRETGQVARGAVHLRNAPTKLMKELGYGHAYRYAHDEPNAYAAGETYLPDGMREPRWYKPVPREPNRRSPTSSRGCANSTARPARRTDRATSGAACAGAANASALAGRLLLPVAERLLMALDVEFGDAGVQALLRIRDREVVDRGRDFLDEEVQQCTRLDVADRLIHVF